MHLRGLIAAFKGAFSTVGKRAAYGMLWRGGEGGKFEGSGDVATAVFEMSKLWIV